MWWLLLLLFVLCCFACSLGWVSLVCVFDFILCTWCCGILLSLIVLCGLYFTMYVLLVVCLLWCLVCVCLLLFVWLVDLVCLIVYGWLLVFGLLLCFCYDCYFVLILVWFSFGLTCFDCLIDIVMFVFILVFCVEFVLTCFAVSALKFFGCLVGILFGCVNCFCFVCCWFVCFNLFTGFVIVLDWCYCRRLVGYGLLFVLLCFKV